VDLWTVHPHTRGEHGDIHGYTGARHGSSPHTWGTPPDAGRDRVTHRFIPTHVGNTPDGGRQRHAMAVHPHTRGEHHAFFASDSMDAGSSPHTWGTHMPGRDIRYRHRFIPTHVGNTYGHAGGLESRSVHPHTRGEHTSHTPSI